jgi:hypothetical protein
LSGEVKKESQMNWQKTSWLVASQAEPTGCRSSTTAPSCYCQGLQATRSRNTVRGKTLRERLGLHLVSTNEAAEERESPPAGRTAEIKGQTSRLEQQTRNAPLGKQPSASQAWLPVA